MKKVIRWVSNAAAGAAVLVGAIFLSCPAVANNDQLMKRIDADMEFPSEDYAAISDKISFDEVLVIKIEQHATRNYDRPDRVEGLLAFIMQNNIVTADGQLAAVAYHNAMKLFFPGSMPLFSGFYEKWQQESPQSPVPIIVKASNMLSVDAEALRAALLYPNNRIEELTIDKVSLQKIEQYLLANKALASRDPYWYHLMVEVAIFLGENPDDIKALVQEGLEKFPDDIQLPVLASNRFASKWGGQANDIFHYAEWAQALPAMQNRPDLYPRIYAQAMQSQYGLKLFQLVRTDWDKMHAGIRAMSRSFDSVHLRNMGAALACLRGDRKLTWDLIATPRFKPVFSFWPDPDAFAICQNWALPVDLHEAEASTGAEPVLQDAVNP